jgi:hypothetical protein
MYSNAIVVAVVALVSGAGAAAINKNLGNFRLFSQPGCRRGNLGVWTVIDDDVANSKCQVLSEPAVQSVFAPAIAQGCTCKSGPFEPPACRLVLCDLLLTMGACNSVVLPGRGVRDWQDGCCQE